MCHRFKQQTFTFSQFWGLDVRDQSAGRDGSDESPLPGWQRDAFLLYARESMLTSKREGGSQRISGVSSYKGTNPIMRALPE